MSHTCELLANVLENIEEYYHEEYVKYIKQMEKKGKTLKVQRITGHWKRKQNRKNLIEKARYIPAAKWLSVGTLREIIEHSEGFDRTYSMLEDQESRDIFDWYVAYRASYSILGSLAKELFPPPVSEESYQNALVELKRNAVERDMFRVEGFHIKSNNIPTIADTWIFNQYRIRGVVEPHPGDVVIDAGAFYGETSLWFSRLVGDTGKVYAFEPFPDNIEVLRHNISNNIGVNNIEIITRGLYNRNGIYSMTGISAVAAIIKQSQGEGNIQFITLDEFVEEKHLDSVDFIKMDIEGSEIEAINGSSRTIARFKPKLAISIYHKKDDIIKIPAVIKGIEGGYHLYLRHCTPGINETILFAKVLK